MSQHGGPVPSQPDHSWALPSHAPSAPAGQSGSGPAVVSMVLSLLAVLSVLAIAAWLLAIGTPLPGETKSPLTGRLPAVPTNGTLPGARLAAAVSATVEHDVGEVSNLKCPTTPRVAQGAVTICHGSIGGDEWGVVVFFENRDGRFTLLEV
jgi:Domain of unknown function (DUF4333)